MNYYEVLAATFGIISVYLSVRQSIWTWPTGIINVALYIIVFFQAKLYADMGLQMVYVVLSFYGWYQWLYGGRDRTELPVARMSGRLSLGLSILCLILSAFLGTVLSRQTDASLPMLDSTTTVVSLIAQWMMTKKFLESWIVWVGVDVVYVGMFIYKSLYVTTGLYLIFLVLAVKGYIEWKKSLDAVPAQG